VNATITGGTVGATVLGGTLNAMNGATITAGTLNAVNGATITAGTLNAVLGATITAGTVNATITGGTVGATVLGGTLNAVNGATITAGTLNAILGATITAGTVSVTTVTQISQANFIEASTTGVAVTSAGTTSFTAVTTGILGGPYSFFVVNTGAGNVNLTADVSADGLNWVKDTAASNVASGAVTVLVPKLFLKYTRLSYSRAGGTNTTIDAYFNAQGA
jgi:hypothetical protein